MLLSMTGFGRGTNSLGDKTITIEVRSLNSKFTDIRFKCPSTYREKEPFLRKLITDYAERGKLDVTIDVKSLTGDDDFGLNAPLFKKYYTELSKIHKEMGVEPGDLTQAILRIQNVIASFEREVHDVYPDFRGIQMTFDLDRFNGFADVFFDNLISDWIVQQKIVNSLNNVKTIYDRVTRLMNSLNVDREKTIEFSKQLIVDKDMIILGEA